MLDAKKIKKDFPILSRKINGKPLVYLDNGATTQKPRVVIEAISDYYQKHNANVHRGIHTLGDESTRIYADARKTVAEFFGADANELVFVRNATEGINLVAYSWGRENLKKGDEVVIDFDGHHSNIVPWQILAKELGIRLVEKVSAKTKLLVLTHVSNVTGKMVKITPHSKNLKVLVDGAQAVGHMKVDVKDLGVDFYVFSGHKMLGPMGIGGLYIRREVQGEMGPFMTGGGMIDEVSLEKSTWARGVEKWEAGTPNVAGAVGLKAAVEYLKDIGVKNIEKHENGLTDYCARKLKNVGGVKIVGKENGIVSFVMEGVHGHDVAQILDSVGVAVRSGHHCTMPFHKKLGVVATTRASFYIYNDEPDIDRLLEGISKVRGVFK